VTPAPAHRVSARLSAIAPSATLAVDAKAKALKAAGRPVIGFGAGEPDFPTPDYIVEAAVAAAKDPANHKYSPAKGLRTTVEVFAGADQDYKVSVDQLEAARTERTKVLLLCSPSNPTGSVYTPEELTAIGQWALEHGIWVITDEIYEHLLYDGAQAAHIVKLVPELAEQTIVLNGVAKTYAMTGWRVGWMIGPSDVIKAATNFQSHLSSNVANVSQRAALAAVSGDLAAVEQMRTAFDRRRRTMVEMLSQIEGLTVPVPRGAFYAYPAIERLLGRTLRGTKIDSSATLAALILEHAEVAVVPGEAFGPSGFLRLSYALGDDDLAEGVGRIQRLLAAVE